MDPGDWIFYVIVALSVIGSIAKNVKKKKAQPQDEGETEAQGHDAEKWIKTILEDVKNASQIDSDDDYIPKNPTLDIPRPTAERSINWSSKEARSAETRVSPEKFRRNNNSPEQYRRSMDTAETFTRSNQSHEDNFIIEGFDLGQPLSMSGQTTQNSAAAIVTKDQSSSLVPEQDLKGVENIKKAIIYGEILRKKF